MSPFYIFLLFAIGVILFIFSIIFVVVFFYWWFASLHVSKCVNNMPHVKITPMVTYWTTFKSVTRQTLAPTLYYILQILCAGCTMFDKERIFSFWLSFRPFVLFYKPETIEGLLNSHSTIDKSIEYKFLHPWLGKGLLTSTGDKWRSRRKLLTPAFHFRILEDFIPVFSEQSQILVNKLKTLSKSKEWLDIVPLVTMCTLDIICETTMGVRIDAQTNFNSEYIKAIYEIGETFIYRAIRPWLWIDSLFYLFPSGWKFKKNVSIVHGFTRKVIKEKKREMIFNQKLQKEGKDKNSETNNTDSVFEKPARRRAFLQLLLEQHLLDPNFTEEDIREEVDTFMFEGHDTTAMGVSFALYNIGLKPDVQEKIYNELDSIFYGDTERPITTEDLKAMKYLDCAIKESLRLYPSVPFLARELKEDIKILDYTIAPGTTCLIMPLMLHRDPDIYPNPEVFDPDRFLPENCAGRHPYAYIPFSAGPRNCIGQRFASMEEKTIVANILRNFEVRSLDPQDRMHLIPDLILRNVEPIRIQLIPR